MAFIVYLFQSPCLHKLNANVVRVNVSQITTFIFREQKLILRQTTGGVGVQCQQFKNVKNDGTIAATLCPNAMTLTPGAQTNEVR